MKICVVAAGQTVMKICVVAAGQTVVKILSGSTGQLEVLTDVTDNMVSCMPSADWMLKTIQGNAGYHASTPWSHSET